MAETHDVVVVGAGLLGLAAGRAVAARGHDVLVLEQADIGHQGSGSKGSCRIFRLGYPDPGYVTAARQARGLWHQLEAESGRQILRPTPHLTFGSKLMTVHDGMRAAGAPCELLSAAEAAERYPDLATGGPALLEPESCVISADEALAALAAAVPQIRTGVRVTSLADDGQRVTLHTSDGVLTARTVVVAAGPSTGLLLATRGITAPSRPTMEQAAYLAPAGDAALSPPIFICHIGQEPYGLPVPGSSLYKIGIHHGGPVCEPDDRDQAADPELTARLIEVARAYLPGYHCEPVSTERCIYDNSPDEDFIVDRVGNVVMGCGTSGHGFKFGPLFGEWLATLATGEPGPAADARFGLARFG